MTRIISPREDVKLLVVSVPEGATDFEIGPAIRTPLSLNYFDEHGYLQIIDLPPGDYIPLGIATEITEEVTRELVEAWERNGLSKYKGFKDYDRGHLFYCHSPTESWHSFLRREGITGWSYVLKVKEAK